MRLWMGVDLHGVFHLGIIVCVKDFVLFTSRELLQVGGDAQQDQDNEGCTVRKCNAFTSS